MISNSFLDNGFNDIIGFNSRTVPLKRFGLDSERTYSTISSDAAAATQPKSIILKVLMMNQNPAQILLGH